MTSTSSNEAIRLTNKTAKNLHKQAKQQRTALYALATLLSIVLCCAAVLIGMIYLIAVPLIVLTAIVLDAMLIMIARYRYISLTGQAICTEAAARQIQQGASEMHRLDTARRDLERIKQDIETGGAQEDDEDMYAPKSVRKLEKSESEDEDEDAQNTRALPVAQRRRRQARLQVISGEAPDTGVN